MGFKKECGRRWRMILTAALLLFGCAGSLAGCSASGTGNAEAGALKDAAGNSADRNTGAGDGRLQVAATIFPYYDFLRQIGGDRIGLQLVVPAGSQVRLIPGESITIYPCLYHDFQVEPGSGPVLLGEVSQCNDDNTDNRFYEKLGRFPAIEEDEPPYRLLCNEYPAAK